MAARECPILNPARGGQCAIRRLIPLAAVVYVAAATATVAAVPAGDTLVPNSTKAFVSLVNVPTLVTHWEKTQLYQLLEDPVMKPFTEDLHRQLDEKWLSNHEKIGLSIEDLRSIASGELSGRLWVWPSRNGRHWSFWST